MENFIDTLNKWLKNPPRDEDKDSKLACDKELITDLESILAEAQERVNQSQWPCCDQESQRLVINLTKAYFYELLTISSINVFKSIIQTSTDLNNTLQAISRMIGEIATPQDKQKNNVSNNNWKANFGYLQAILLNFTNAEFISNSNQPNSTLTRDSFTQVLDHHLQEIQGDTKKALSKYTDYMNTEKLALVYNQLVKKLQDQLKAKSEAPLYQPVHAILNQVRLIAGYPDPFTKKVPVHTRHLLNKVLQTVSLAFEPNQATKAIEDLNALSDQLLKHSKEFRPLSYLLLGMACAMIIIGIVALAVPSFGASILLTCVGAGVLLGVANTTLCMSLYLGFFVHKKANHLGCSLKQLAGKMTPAVEAKNATGEPIDEILTPSPVAPTPGSGTTEAV